MISLARIYYPVEVLGPGKRIGIWMNGCSRNCPECISPEMQGYDTSKEITVNDVLEIVGKIQMPVGGFTISGGEPFFKPESLNELVVGLSEINDDILIYTGYTLNELKSMKDHNIENVLAHCAALVDGPYIKDLNDGVALRGSSNQQLRVFKHKEKYTMINKQEREIQTIVSGERIISIGIPKGVVSK